MRQKVSGLLFSHLQKVSTFVDSLPFIMDCFQDSAQRQRITMSCFVELIVLRYFCSRFFNLKLDLRWAATTDSRASMITGIDGSKFQVKNTVSIGNSWGAKFKEYFLLSQRHVFMFFAVLKHYSESALSE